MLKYMFKIKKKISKSLFAFLIITYLSKIKHYGKRQKKAATYP